MKWEKALLISSVEKGKDELGNSIKQNKEVGTVEMRISPWSSDDVALEGREVTSTQQKFICKKRYELMPMCDKVIWCGLTYLITRKVRHGNRYTALYVENYKKEKYVDN